MGTGEGFHLRSSDRAAALAAAERANLSESGVTDTRVGGKNRFLDAS